MLPAPRTAPRKNASRTHFCARSDMGNPRTATLTLGAAGTVTGSKYLLLSTGASSSTPACSKEAVRIKNREFPVSPDHRRHPDHPRPRGPHVVPPRPGQARVRGRSCTEPTAADRDRPAIGEAAGAVGAGRHPRRPVEARTPDAPVRHGRRRATLPLLTTVEWETNVDIAGVLWARWVRAGHIRSASIHVEVGPVPCCSATSVATATRSSKAGRAGGRGLVVCESTTATASTLPRAASQPLTADPPTVERGGSIVPAFAIDRTEAVLRAGRDAEGGDPRRAGGRRRPHDAEGARLHRSFADEPPTPSRCGLHRPGSSRRATCRRRSA